VVAETYKQANGHDFSIAAISNPLHMPTTWAYLYMWYSQNHKLLVPKYHGDVELIYPGQTIFSNSKKIYPLEFVIIEPEINEYWQKKDLGEEIIRTDFLNQKYFKRIVLQTRIIKGKTNNAATINKNNSETTFPK
jgi:hypothetical protein